MKNPTFQKAQRQRVKLKLAITGPSGSERIGDIAFASNGTLYAVGNVNNDSNKLYTLDINSGVMSLVGAMGVSDIDSLTFGPDGFLYGADAVLGEADLYRIDPATAGVDNLGSMGVITVNGLYAIPEPLTLSLFVVGSVALINRRGRKTKFPEK